MKATQRNIVEATGLSTATVSRALNGVGKVSPQVRRQVLECAARLGYTHRKRNTVTMIVPELGVSPYYQTVIREIGTQLQFLGYEVEVIPSASLALIEEHMPCGVISILAENGLERYWGKQFAIPLVCVNTRPRHFDGIFTVFSDEEQGMRLATEHLIGLGHRRIGVLGGDAWLDDENYSSALRCKTFREIMSRNHLPDHLVATHSWMERELDVAVARLLEMEPSAIIVPSETESYRVLHLLRRYGKCVPNDVSLLGWLDPEVEFYSDPPITGVLQSYNHIARHAIAMLIRLMQQKPVLDDVCIPYSFCPRGSTAPPR